MEGRDIGTVVFPDADVKVYLDAKPPERARRRFEEVRAKGEEVPKARCGADAERPARQHARGRPLAQAPDAIYLTPPRRVY
jgi:cytidylate kinase